MAGPVYFALVFAAGFVLGVLRVLLVVPHVGVMWAELMEAPLMLAAIVLAARWTVRRFNVAATWRARIGMGLLALGLLLCAELTLVLALRGLSIAEYIASREPVSGTVYVVLLVLFAGMPALLARR
ncbi:MAG: hypothetical protein WCE38_25495 [Burkholderiales bacterium]